MRRASAAGVSASASRSCGGSAICWAIACACARITAPARVFSIEIALPQVASAPKLPEPGSDFGPASDEKAARKGAILVVEDDPALRELLAVSLKEEGHRVARAYDGSEAMQLVEREDFRPDLILADFNLPNGMNGLEVVAKVRERLHRAVPAIILTGDISTDDIARHSRRRLRAAQQAGETGRCDGRRAAGAGLEARAAAR